MKMNKKTFIFDLENTLINLKNHKPYFSNLKGKVFLANNFDRIQTYVDDEIKNLFESYNQFEDTYIKSTTYSEKYTKKLLEKHGFSRNIRIIKDLNQIENKPENSILITDSSIKVLDAQKLKFTSLGVNWGYNTSTQLRKAGVNHSVTNSEDLFQLLNRFKQEKFGFKKRESTSKGVDLSLIDKFNPDIDILSIGKYAPYNGFYRDLFYSTGSDKILTYKKIKDYTEEEINSGLYEQYFYNGIQNGNKYLDIFWYFEKRLEQKISKLNLKGKTLVYGMPNSNPDFCYRIDINDETANTINENLYGLKTKNRLIQRMFETKASHLGGSRNPLIQYYSIGVQKDKIPNDVRNIVLIDDITTSGNQLKSTAKIIRAGLEFKGNLYGITLGRTI